MKAVLLKNIGACYDLPILHKGDSLFLSDSGFVVNPSKDLMDNADKIIDCSGYCLSPGWVDMHTHVYKGVCDIAVEPDLIGPQTGVTHIVDAGSSGCVTFAGLRDYLIDTRDFWIHPFLNLGSAGIIRCNKICDYETPDFIQPDKTYECVQQNKDLIKGLKVRACKVVLKGKGLEIVKIAADIAEASNLPLMVHVGEGPPDLEGILDLLKAGDIITHCFHGKPGNIINPDNYKVFDYVWNARRRGILFDVGHGGASFNFQIAKTAMSQGFSPDLIGTDLHTGSLSKAGSLAGVMMKLVACGMSLDEVVRAVSLNSRKVLGLPDFTDMRKDGKYSDFTIFSINDVSRKLFDSQGNGMSVDMGIQPVGVFYNFKGNFYDVISKTRD